MTVVLIENILCRSWKHALYLVTDLNTSALDEGNINILLLFQEVWCYLQWLCVGGVQYPGSIMGGTWIITRLKLIWR